MKKNRTITKPVGCTEYHPGSCSACLLAEAHVHTSRPDGPGRRVATFYGHRAVALAEVYAAQHAQDYAGGLDVLYDPRVWVVS